MNFSVVLKLSRLFLKICRWILVNMSLNCRFFTAGFCSFTSEKMEKGQNGSSNKEGCLHGGGRCTKKFLFFVWILYTIVVSTWVVFGVRNGNLRWKLLESDEKDHILVRRFNVSRENFHSLASLFLEGDQIASLSCVKKSRYEASFYDSVVCALKVASLKSLMLETGYELAATNMEHKRQCPVWNENNQKNLNQSFPRENLESSTSQSLNASGLEHRSWEERISWMRWPWCNPSYYCKRITFCFTKVCWWILVGVAVTCRLSWLGRKFWRNHEEKLVQPQLLVQPPQPLQHLQQQHAQNSSRIWGKWGRKFLVVFVICGVLASVLIFMYMYRDADLKRKETLASMCEERARMLQDQFNVSMNHVHALAILVSTFHHGKEPSAIDQKTFGEYTETTAFERPLTSGVAYALRVRHSEREAFEKQHGWTIKKMDVDEQALGNDRIPENLDPSPVQDEYAPVIFSQETVSHIVSIDMMSGKEDRENILRARASGKGVLTSPFKLLKSNHLGIVLTFAVYNTHLPPDATPEQRINATMGYLGASYDFPSLVEKLLHQLASKQTIVVNVYDTTNKSAPIRMYGSDIIDTGPLHVSNLDFGDPARKHEMYCSFKQKAPLPWTAIASSLGTLVIILLVGHIFHAGINRIAKMERDVREMMELKHRAEAADIAKSQFLATVSHEIRTPMNGVLGMLQMLMDTNLDDTQLEYAKTAHASGEDLISLINEVLDQAKIESGRLELEAVPFDLRDVLDKVLSLLSGKSHEKGIELAVYVSHQVPDVVIGDPKRFRQIITNLVGNSIKFTREGHIFVSVHLADEVKHSHNVMDEVLRQSLSLDQENSPISYNTLSGFPVVNRWKSWENFKYLNGPVDAESVKLLVTVEDTGGGIPVEAQGRIFTPFVQADSSTSRNYGGTGIGLSISKRLVDLMGGEIGFVSACRTGSTFSFTATFGRTEKNSLGRKSQKFDPAISEFRGLRALLVDGQVIRAEVTRYHLQRLGISTYMTSRIDSACSDLFSSLNKSGLEHLAMILIDKDSCDKEAHLSLKSLLKDLQPNGSAVFSTIPPKIFLLATCMSPTHTNELKSAGLVDNVLIKPLRLRALSSCFQGAGLGKMRQVPRGKPTTLGVLLKDKRILVVDDNAVNRRVAEGALKKYGAIVTCVESGKAAVDHLKPPHNFDACFMDLQMPGMDGFEATRRIRDLERKYNEKIDSGAEMSTVAHWHTPILAMTADVIQATNDECMKCGMNDYVSKPFEQGQLYSAVARFFESGGPV